MVELNKKLENREVEISKLKEVISKSRGSEVEKILKGNKSDKDFSDTEEFDNSVPHDFPLIGYNEVSDYEQFPEEFDEEEEEIEMPIFKKKGSSSKKRRGSRSRSKDRSKRRRNSHSRSRSRNRKDHDNHGKAKHDEGVPKNSKEMELYKNNPEVKNLVEKMVAEQVKEQIEKRRLSETSGMEIFTKIPRNLVKIPSKKSRSEATLYKPAVARDFDNLSGSPSPLRNEAKNNELDPNFENNMMCTPMANTPNGDTRRISQETRQRHCDVDSSKIDDALSKLRVISDERRQHSNNNEDRRTDQMQDARQAAEEAILQAERYKARIQQPNRGNFTFSPKVNKWNDDSLRAMRYLDSEDDEFFHTTCHIDETIREKIEKGKFIELEKLIQKRILQHGFKDEGRMQLINKDGVSYFVPSVDRETKIDNIKKWEQAFRVYTTIYCKANPTRSGEILQYVDIIHRAAAIFNWDNVAKYDYVFRQLMAAKPHRSWAKVYTQMWNLTLNEPIKKFNEGGNSNSNFPHNKNNQRKKDTFCWKYNKKSCTYGRSCKFEHKCSYCGVAGHPVLDCHKKNGKKNSEKPDKKIISIFHFRNPTIYQL